MPATTKPKLLAEPAYENAHLVARDLRLRARTAWQRNCERFNSPV